ncbi:MAG: thiamine phosphate synthase [Bacteroidales bacterium]|nr:thiamine phosphate synthase [Bacteroidales bacterium]
MMIQFISHQNARFSYLDGIKLALEGGCRWVQLRMKDAPDDEIISTAEEVKKLCVEFQATFIVDDHVSLVKIIGADGVHLGKNDMPVDTARRILGKECIIGATANTFDDVENAYNKGADYIGCGPFRFTTTKKNLSPVLGLEGYSEIVKQMKQSGINIPVVAIGGILKEDIPQIMQTGISGIALSGAVLNAQDPVSEMKTILKILKK